MSIRTRIFGPGADDPLLISKKPRGAKADTLESVVVPRAECRRRNARGRDRHRLSSEQAILRHEDAEIVVELINLSAGGAMIRGNFELHLWEHVWLVLDEDGEIDCAVRWIKSNSVGLEFAHETRIDCDKEVRDAMLRAVIQKSFPDAAVIALEYPTRRADDDPAVEYESIRRRQAARHPLIWNGVIYYSDSHAYEAEPVRLRNISVTGALIQCSNPLPEGKTVYLDLRSAGRHPATVKWTRGDQSGLQFHDIFDIHSLSEVPPGVAPSTSVKDAFGNQEPWAPGWCRSTVEQLARSLGG